MADAPGLSSPWVSSSGIVAHPASSKGGGGGGQFGQPGSLGRDGNDSNPIAHPQSPAARYQTLTGDDVEKLVDQGVPLAVNSPDQPPGTLSLQPPPATQPATFKIQRTAAGKENVDVEVQVLADGKDPNPKRASSAHTVLNPKGAVQSFPSWEINAADATKPPNQQKIVELKGVYSIAGKITLQVIYGSLAKAADLAAYGRGTTAADKSSGNRTAGFHESCHLDDFTAWLKTKPLPKFNGKVGMSVKEYEDEMNASEAAYEKYYADAEADSVAKTDEVGSPTLSQYKIDHPGYTH